jgi:hypothetical protein
MGSAGGPHAMLGSKHWREHCCRGGYANSSVRGEREVVELTLELLRADRKRPVMHSYATGLVDFAQVSERGVLRVPAVTQRQLGLSSGRCEPWPNFPE